MKRLFPFLIIALMCSCSSVFHRPDKRDKYVGEYKLYVTKERWGEFESSRWNSQTRSYEKDFIRDFDSDSTRLLVITKYDGDTTSLTFEIVAPLNRTVLESHYSYVKGDDIFIKDGWDGMDCKGVGYDTKITFDSVYLLNDTIHFIKTSSTNFFDNHELVNWQVIKERCYGVKVAN